MPILLRFFTCTLIFSCVQAQACPVYMDLKSFREGPPISARDNYRLFRWNGRRWQSEPLQIDPVDRDNYLVFFDDEQRYSSWDIGDNDRISFLSESFGHKFNGSLSAPCETDFIYEIRDIEGKHVYLASCRDTKTKVDMKPVIYNGEKLTVESKLYNYRYHPTNHMMFDEIRVKPEGAPTFAAGENSLQRIRADVKNFITLNFSDGDIESKLIRTREGPLALVGQLTFFLRLLFLKIDLKLQTIVSFFEDAVHLPLTINMPVDASRMTNPATGMLFSWETPPGVEWDKELSTMPTLDSTRVKQGYKQLGKMGLKNCRASRCIFSLVGTLNGFKWSTEFVIPRPLVKSGFFPMFVSKAGEGMVELGWDKVSQYPAKNIGIYYETSGLGKGQHQFDFWIKIGTKDKSVRRQCPHPVKATRRIAVTQVARELLQRGFESDLYRGVTESDVKTGLHVYRDQQSWQELLDTIDYDVDNQNFATTLNFDKIMVVGYVSYEDGVFIERVNNDAKVLRLNVRRSDTRSDKKHFHFVTMLKDSRKVKLTND